MKEKKNKKDDEDQQPSDPSITHTPPSLPSPKPALPPRKPLTSFFRNGLFNSRSHPVYCHLIMPWWSNDISRRPRLPPPKGDSPSPRSDDNNNGTYLRPDSLLYDTVPDGHSFGSFSSSEDSEGIEAASYDQTRGGRGDSPRRYKTEARIELGQRGSETVTSL